VAILEEIIEQRPPGIGHNKPPSELPQTAEDIDEIIALIKLLKEQPTLPPKPLTIIVEKNSRVRELTDKFFDKLAESAGTAVGKNIGNLPFWYGLYSAARLVVDAVSTWRG